MPRKPDNPEEGFLLDCLQDVYGPLAHKPTDPKHGDASSPYHQWEHKYRNTKGFSITYPFWEKIKNRADSLGKDGIIVVRNSTGERLACLELDSLLKLLKFQFEQEFIMERLKIRSEDLDAIYDELEALRNGGGQT